MPHLKNVIFSYLKLIYIDFIFARILFFIPLLKTLLKWNVPNQNQILTFTIKQHLNLWGPDSKSSQPKTSLI